MGKTVEARRLRQICDTVAGAGSSDKLTWITERHVQMGIAELALKTILRGNQEQYYRAKGMLKEKKPS